MPQITALMVKTGFQSSRKIFKHTLPSKSMFGWQTFVTHLTFKVNVNFEIALSLIHVYSGISSDDLLLKHALTSSTVIDRKIICRNLQEDKTSYVKICELIFLFHQQIINNISYLWWPVGIIVANGKAKNKLAPSIKTLIGANCEFKI